MGAFNVQIMSAARQARYFPSRAPKIALPIRT
jgi:hypothetical protein